MDHRVCSAQSGVRYYPLYGESATYAACVVQAALISLQHPQDQVCVVPNEFPSLSARPPLSDLELVALAFAGSAVRQTVLLQNGG